MRIGLFGKILLAFWLTLFVMGQGLWLFYSTHSGIVGSEQRAALRIGPPLLTLLAHRLEVSGPDDVKGELALLSPRMQEKISIKAMAPGDAPPTSTRFRMVQEAVAPDGRTYAIVYLAPGGRGSLDFQPSILFTAVGSGLVFSVALVFYLSRPLYQLRQGFRRVAQGDLNVQLSGRFDRRGDELSDVARDFDMMVERLRQLLGARDRLLNDVSHELRSPLTRLQLAIGLARQDPLRTEDSLDRIDREAQKLDAMVNELLALARAESGAGDDVTEYFDPIAVIESVVSDAAFEAQVSGRNINLVTAPVPAGGWPSVAGSAELVRRALENVVRNALRFSPSGGTVEVAVDLEGEPLAYRFVITDEGEGVAEEALGTLFEPFVRADPSGVGLGLAIARRAIIAHDGKISAHNRSCGGFLVEIELPAVPHETPA